MASGDAPDGLQQLRDREDLRDLVSQYCHHIDGGRDDAWVDCFTDDGVFDSPILGRWEGREALQAFTKHYREWTGPTQPRHCVVNVVLELLGPERARGECYLLLTHAGDGHTDVVVSGVYEDQFQKVDGRWRFRERRIRPDTQPA